MKNTKGYYQNGRRRAGWGLNFDVRKMNLVISEFELGI